MKATQICQYLNNSILSGGIAEGKVHSVFQHACNIEAGQYFITLLGSKKPMAPMSVRITDLNEGGVDFVKLEITQNLSVSFYKDSLRSNHICIFCPGKKIYINTADASLWSPDIDCTGMPVSESVLPGNLKVFRKVLENCGNFGGAGQLFGRPGENTADGHFRFIKPGSLRFMEALKGADPVAVSRDAKTIIGFGPGLTPSMDDFLCGVMIALKYLGEFFGFDTGLTAKMNGKIIGGNLDRTTRVSAEMLKHAAEGRASEPVKELMRALLYQKDHEAIKKAASAALDMGETSGTDLLLGIDTGFEVAFEWEKRRIGNAHFIRGQEEHVL